MEDDIAYRRCDHFQRYELEVSPGSWHPFSIDFHDRLANAVVTFDYSIVSLVAFIQTHGAFH